MRQRIDRAIGFRRRQHQVVTGSDLVDKLQIDGLATVPMFAGGDRVDIQSRAVLGHEILEQAVGIVELLAEFLAVGVGVVAEHRQRALVVTRGVQLHVDMSLVQPAMKIGQLRHHADRADDGKGGSDDTLAHAGHHVTAGSRDPVDRHRQSEAGLAQTIKLRSRQPVAVNQPAAGLQAQQDLVVLGGHLEQGIDRFTQRLDRGGPDIAVELQHEQA